MADKLRETLTFLRNAAPKEFAEFVKAYEAYTTKLTVAVIDAPPDTVFQAQGMARQCHYLCRLMKELPT